MPGIQETALIVFFCVAVFAVKYVLADRYDAVVEGRKALRKLKGKLNPVIIEDQRINEILRRFRASISLNYPPTNLYLIEGRSPNAASLPGGIVLITEGLFDLFESNLISMDEMAAIIAHEIGHSELAHWRKRIKAKAKGDLIASLVTGKAGLFGKAAANFVTEKSLGLLSQDDEFQADQYATDLLEDSGFCPVGLATALRKLDTSDLPSFVYLLTQHPPTGDRITRIRSHQQNKKISKE